MYTGKVIHGSKIGTTLLGIPTANLDIQHIDIEEGIYYGYAYFKKTQGTFKDHPDIKYKCVLSIGTNPTFDTVKKTFEVHILHTFDSTFYGETLIVDIVGFIRKSIKYTSIDKLIEQIHDDIKYALNKLNA